MTDITDKYSFDIDTKTYIGAVDLNNFEYLEIKPSKNTVYISIDQKYTTKIHETTYIDVAKYQKNINNNKKIEFTLNNQKNFLKISDINLSNISNVTINQNVIDAIIKPILENVTFDKVYDILKQTSNTNYVWKLFNT